MKDQSALVRPPLLHTDFAHGTVGQNLHLCNNYRHLLIALTTIAAAGHSAIVVYLEDELPIPEDLRIRLARACPLAELIFTGDAIQIDAFARLPGWLPPIFRRNLTLDRNMNILRPHTWQPPLLAGRRFATAYLYHPGFFLSKVIAGLSQRVVLRESGLNNYEPIQVPPLKSVLRWLSGLPPRRQIWGEEPWIHKIEVSHPDNLSSAVRSKAYKLTFSDVMDEVPPVTAHTIAAAFLGNIPGITEHGRRAVLLLTQPIDRVGICTFAEKQMLYEQIALFLTKAGYQLHVKPHPLESPMAISGAVILPSAFPIEAWPYFSDQKFTLAVALCSASLLAGARAFTLHAIQLLPPARFNARHFSDWPVLIASALETIPHRFGADMTQLAAADTAQPPAPPTR